MKQLVTARFLHLMLLALASTYAFTQSAVDDFDHATSKDEVSSDLEVDQEGGSYVNYFQGTPQIKIPIYTLEKNGYKIPIYLLYSSNGIKVNEGPGILGHGWSLIAGGHINRLKKGEIDEDPNGFLSLGNQVLDETKYELPDLFFYSTPSTSGQFIFDHEGNPFSLPLKADKIITPIGPQVPDGVNERFQIIDTKGFKHVFNEEENREITKVMHKSMRYSKISLRSEGNNIYVDCDEKIDQSQDYWNVVRGEDLHWKLRDIPNDDDETGEQYTTSWKLTSIYDL
ncbi:MAG: hypothetical protein AAF901_12895, partial [Bacteroidota bacterium]